MHKYKTNELVFQKILLLLPLIIYGIYKNGVLIYQKNLTNLYLIFKPLYLVLISVGIKFLFDLIKYKKLRIDYDLLEVIIIAMLMPYNINLGVYSVGLSIFYLLFSLLSKVIKFNKVCIIYFGIILSNMLFNPLTFKNILELEHIYNFSFLDLLIGRGIGGIATSSIFFSLIAYIFLVFNFYYKKDIPLVINLVYLLLSFIYYLITNNSTLLLNSDLVFASVFVSTLPKYSPYTKKRQYVYGVFIGILSFVLMLYLDKSISVYLSVFIVSIFANFKRK